MARQVALLVLALALALPLSAAQRAVPRVPVLTAPTAPAQARLQEILSAALPSPTAMAILDRAAVLRKDAIPVAFTKMGTDHGYYDYERDRVFLAARYGRGDARRAVPTLVHEILHVSQEEARTPAQALERELEAHALTIRILDELGLKDEGSFSVAARARLTAGPGEFRDWMRLQHYTQFEHRPRARAEIVSELEYDLDESDARVSKLSEALEKAPSSRRVRALLDDALLKNAGLRREIERLSRAGWRRYKRFAARVQSVLEAEHARLSAAR